ncbi:hypothetical protein J6590_062779 [Homalodisca vitripennis]|nr:hypothetical protein J6590_062779 [Homalodisca vitripennis]
MNLLSISSFQNHFRNVHWTKPDYSPVNDRRHASKQIREQNSNVLFSGVTPQLERYCKDNTTANVLKSKPSQQGLDVTRQITHCNIRVTDGMINLSVSFPLSERAYAAPTPIAHATWGRNFPCLVVLEWFFYAKEGFLHNLS